jgi:hypothetical protein
MLIRRASDLSSRETPVVSDQRFCFERRFAEQADGGDALPLQLKIGFRIASSLSWQFKAMAPVVGISVVSIASDTRATRQDQVFGTMSVALSILIRNPRLTARYVQNLEYPHGVRVERIEFGAHAPITAFYRFFKNSGRERQCQIGVLAQNTRPPQSKLTWFAPQAGHADGFAALERDEHQFWIEIVRVHVSALHLFKTRLQRRVELMRLNVQAVM